MKLETERLYPEESNRVLLKREGKEDKIFKCNFLCDRLRTEGAETLGIYGDDFYAGEPCFTVNKYGKGKAYYLGTKPEDDCLQLIVQQIAKEAGVKSPLEVPEGVEVACRENENGKFAFILNHTLNEKRIMTPEGATILVGTQESEKELILQARDVAVLKL